MVTANRRSPGYGGASTSTLLVVQPINIKQVIEMTLENKNKIK